MSLLIESGVFLKMATQLRRAPNHPMQNLGLTRLSETGQILKSDQQVLGCSGRKGWWSIAKRDSSYWLEQLILCFVTNDLSQVRIQLTGGGPIGVAKEIMAKEGFGYFYKVIICK
jgi:hypothetical protein